MRESLQSVGKALAVVRLLADGGEMSLQEISAELQMPRTSVHRVLAKLREHAYVAQNGNMARYHLGPALWEIGMQVPQTFHLYEVAMPFLQQLAEQLGRMTVLALYDRGDVLAVGRVVRSGTTYVAQPAATRSPSYCSAIGKIVLAYQPASEIERVLDGELATFTSFTIADPDQLRGELEQTRARGYAVNRGEHSEEICGVSAPIVNYAGRMVAAAGVSCPGSDFSSAFINEALPPLLESARVMSTAFGLRDSELDRASLA